MRRVVPPVARVGNRRRDRGAAGGIRPFKSAARQCGPERMAAPCAHLARGRSAVAARGGHDSNTRALLLGHRIAAAGGLGKYRSRGPRGALPSDGSTYVTALWLEFARVLRQEFVPQLHRSARPTRRG